MAKRGAGYTQSAGAVVAQWLMGTDEKDMIMQFEELKKTIGIECLRNHVDGSKQGNYILHTLAKSGKSNAMFFLVREYGFDVNVQRASDGCTCLHLAAWGSNLALIETLRNDMGADPHIKNKYGEDVTSMLSNATRSPLKLKNDIQKARGCNDVLRLTENSAWGSATPIEVAMALNRMTKFKDVNAFKSDQRCINLIEQCARLVDEADGDVVSAIAAATVQMPMSSLLAKLASLPSQEGRLESFNAHQLARLATSLPRSHLGDRIRPVYHAIADVASSRLGEMDPIDIAELCLVFGKAFFRHDEFCRLVGTHVFNISYLANMDNKCVSDIIWSFGRLQMYDKSCLIGTGSVAAALAVRVPCYSDEEVSNVMWGVATLHVRHQLLLEALFLRAKPLLEHTCVSTNKGRIKHPAALSAQNLQLLFALKVYHQIFPDLLHDLISKDKSETCEPDLAFDMESVVSSLDDLASVQDLDDLLRSMKT